MNESLDSFTGYRLELLFLLSVMQDEISLSKSLYNQIIDDGKIPLDLIKENVGILWLKKHRREIFDKFMAEEKE